MIKNFIAEPIVIGLDNEINNNVEIWKDVVGYEGLYEVSNQKSRSSPFVRPYYKQWDSVKERKDSKRKNSLKWICFSSSIHQRKNKVA